MLCRAADLICQICLGPLRSCLALKPCGHNFCASCLSHHFAALLQVQPPLHLLVLLIILQGRCSKGYVLQTLQQMYIFTLAGRPAAELPAAMREATAHHGKPCHARAAGTQPLTTGACATATDAHWLIPTFRRRLPSARHGHGCRPPAVRLAFWMSVNFRFASLNRYLPPGVAHLALQ